WHFERALSGVARRPPGRAVPIAPSRRSIERGETPMSQHKLIPCHTALAFAFLTGFALPALAATDARVSETYGKLPLQFEANRGQAHKDVRFLSRGPGYSLYLTAGEAVLVPATAASD